MAYIYLYFNLILLKVFLKTTVDEVNFNRNEIKIQP